MTSRDFSYFRIAKEVSKLSDYGNGRIKIGCVVVYKNRIISTGYNSDKTNPLQKRYNQYRFSTDTPHKIHAEVDSLLPLIHNRFSEYSKLKIYLYRELRNGDLGPSRPCKSCMQLLKDIGIRYIYYTTYDGYVYEYIN